MIFFWTILLLVGVVVCAAYEKKEIDFGKLQTCSKRACDETIFSHDGELDLRRTWTWRSVSVSGFESVFDLSEARVVSTDEWGLRIETDPYASLVDRATNTPTPGKKPT